MRNSAHDGLWTSSDEDREGITSGAPWRSDGAQYQGRLGDYRGALTSNAGCQTDGKGAWTAKELDHRRSCRSADRRHKITRDGKGLGYNTFMDGKNRS